MDQLKINSRDKIAKRFKSESLKTFSVFGMSKRLEGDMMLEEQVYGIVA